MLLFGEKTITTSSFSGMRCRIDPPSELYEDGRRGRGRRRRRGGGGAGGGDGGGGDGGGEGGDGGGDGGGGEGGVEGGREGGGGAGAGKQTGVVVDHGRRGSDGHDRVDHYVAADADLASAVDSTAARRDAVGEVYRSRGVEYETSGGIVLVSVALVVANSVPHVLKARSRRPGIREAVAIVLYPASSQVFTESTSWYVMV